jgi:uncharacterized protein (TIGR00369 family)
VTTPSAPSSREQIERARGQRGQPRGPIYGHGALGQRTFGEGSCEETLTLLPWMFERDGRATVGSIVLLADSVTGWAMSASLPEGLMMVTAQIRVELFGSRPSGTRAIRAVARARHADAQVGFTAADLSTDDGPLGISTMRSAHVHPGEYGSIDDGPWPLADGCVDEALATTTVAVSDDAAHVRVLAPRALANATGNVHGGILALLAERAIVAVAGRTEDVASLRPLDIDVSFPRPLAADDTMVDATASVISRSRRFVQFEAEVARPGGKPSVAVRATYARSGGTGV